MRKIFRIFIALSELKLDSAKIFCFCLSWNVDLPSIKEENKNFWLNQTLYLRIFSRVNKVCLHATYLRFSLLILQGVPQKNWTLLLLLQVVMSSFFGDTLYLFVILIQATKSPSLHQSHACPPSLSKLLNQKLYSTSHPNNVRGSFDIFYIWKFAINYYLYFCSMLQCLSDSTYRSIQCVFIPSSGTHHKSTVRRSVLVDNNLSVYEIMENESLFHDTTRQRSGVE